MNKNLLTLDYAKGLTEDSKSITFSDDESKREIRNKIERIFTSMVGYENKTYVIIARINTMPPVITHYPDHAIDYLTNQIKDYCKVWLHSGLV